MTQKIGFVGKSGTGKSVIVSHISVALINMGYHVLQIGNDISLESTRFLNMKEEMVPVLEEYREHYVINIEDYIKKGAHGVYLMELGNVTSGIGCQARGLEMAMELLYSQKVIEKLKLDYILYDCTVDTPCAGCMLTFNKGIMDRCIVVTDETKASLCVANSILSSIQAEVDKAYVQLLANKISSDYKLELEDYSKMVNIPILSMIDCFDEMQLCETKRETVFSCNKEGIAADKFSKLAYRLIQESLPVYMTPFSRKDLFLWQQQWKDKGIAHVLNGN